MRTIKKRPVPATLVTWRQQRVAAHGADGFEFTYEAMRRDEAVVKDMEDNLHGEQGAICAYTGRRIWQQCAQESGLSSGASEAAGALRRRRGH